MPLAAVVTVDVDQRRKLIEVGAEVGVRARILLGGCCGLDVQLADIGGQRIDLCRCALDARSHLRALGAEAGGDALKCRRDIARRRQSRGAGVGSFGVTLRLEKAVLNCWNAARMPVAPVISNS